MNSIQKYVLDSLFAQNQITADSLAKALETFSNETAIDAFLTVLITGKTEVECKEEQADTVATTKTGEKFTKNSRIRIQINANEIGKAAVIVELAKTFNISRINVKHILDECSPNGIFQDTIYITIPQEIYDVFHIFPDVTENLMCKLNSYSWCYAGIVEE